MEGQYPNAMNKIGKITGEKNITNQGLFIEKLIKEMKPVTMGDKKDGFECREKLLLGFFWKVWTNINLMQRKKLTVFHFDTPLIVVFFKLSSCWRNWSL